MTTVVQFYRTHDDDLQDEFDRMRQLHDKFQNDANSLVRSLCGDSQAVATVGIIRGELAIVSARTRETPHGFEDMGGDECRPELLSDARTLWDRHTIDIPRVGGLQWCIESSCSGHHECNLSMFKYGNRLYAGYCRPVRSREVGRIDPHWQPVSPTSYKVRRKCVEYEQHVFSRHGSVFDSTQSQTV